MDLSNNNKSTDTSLAIENIMEFSKGCQYLMLVLHLMVGISVFDAGATLDGRNVSI